MNDYWDQLKKTIDDFHTDLQKANPTEDDCNSYIEKKAELIGYTNSPSFLTDHAPGQYIRNDDTIIISAPNIIIGNVDAYGNAIGDGIVTLRSSNIHLEGAAMNGEGEIVSRAANIMNIAEHPGPDGKENSVGTTSRIVLQARDVSLVSSNEVGRFSSPSSRTQSGVNILSDSGVNIDASAPTDKKRKKILEDELEKIKNGRVGHLYTMNKIWECAETTFNSLRGVLDDSSQQRLDGKPVEGNIYLLDQLRKNLEDFTINFASDLQRFIAASSDVAKDNFNIFYLQSQIDSLENENKLDENKSTGAHVCINSEFMSLSTNDETGNMRTNPTSGIALNANCVLVSGTKNGVVSDNSMICMEAENITMDTSKCKYSDAERKNGSCTSQGEVNINTKSLNVESFDYKIENEEKKVDKLSGEGQVCIKTMGVLVDTSDEKKKAAGYVSVNSNIINLTSYDSDNGSKVAPSGQINMGANKVKVGTAFEGLDSESVQMVSKTTNVVGVETATIGMGKEGKDAEVSLSGKVVSVVGQSLESSTPTSSFNEVKILKKLTAPDAEIANLNTNGQLNAGAISNNAPKVPNSNKPLNNTAKAAIKQDAPAKKEDKEKKEKVAKILKQDLGDDD